MAYVLKRPRQEDVFLSRLRTDLRAIHVVKVESGTLRGYTVAPSIRKSWQHLEDSLLRLSGILLEAVRDGPESKFPFDPYWPNPSEFRYKEVHISETAARISALKARDACLLLAARCSMAIALCSRDPDAQPPHWVPLLMNAGVPSAWIDLLRESAISDLSPDMRVGTVLCLTEGESATRWLNHVPCMIRANLPVYICWPPQSALQDVLRQYPFLLPYLPDFASVPILNVNDQPRLVTFPRLRYVGEQTSF
ncbi:hypothetical protein BV20DRAFT_937302, partial [Pilatotrama ljubarskyi]